MPYKLIDSILFAVIFAIMLVSPTNGQTQRPTVLEYLRMSGAAYNPYDIGGGWVELDRSNSAGNNDQNGYFGIAYINDSTRQLVIAHRGTDNWFYLRLIENWRWQGMRESDVGDNVNLFFSRVPRQFTESAIEFIRKVLNQRRPHQLEYDISHTGHSLGGALAELGAAWSTCQEGPYASAVTFDGPGTKQIVELNYCDAGQEPEIITFVIAPNVVNTAGVHYGRMIAIAPDWRNIRLEPRFQTAFAVREYLRTLEIPFGSVISEMVSRLIDVASLPFEIFRYAVPYSVGYAHNRSEFESLLARRQVVEDVTSIWQDGWRAGLRFFRYGWGDSDPVLLPNADSALLGMIPTEDIRLDHLDLIFVIDTTGSMSDDIASVRREAIRIVEDVSRRSGTWRIGIVTYRDLPTTPHGDPGDYQSNVELGFSSDPQQIVRAISDIRVGGGGNNKESVYSGLMEAIGFDWRDGAKKALIVMGDAPPHDPEPGTGYTLDTVLQAAWDVDPANVYPILIGDHEKTRLAFLALAGGSSGRMFRAVGAADVVDVIYDTVEDIVTRPELSSILKPGDLARINASGFPIVDRLNLRAGPSLDYEVIGKITIGTIVTVLDGPQYADTHLWWQIRLPNGEIGWSVEAADAEITLIPIMPRPEYSCGSAPTPILEMGVSARVLRDRDTALRVRAEPSTSAHVEGQLNHGEGFDVREGPVCADGYFWWRIRAGSIRGWIAEGIAETYWVEPLE